jgi:hypothetical protein
VILAKELERLVNRRSSVVTECINSFLACCHACCRWLPRLDRGRFNGFYRITAR